MKILIVDADPAARSEIPLQFQTSEFDSVLAHDFQEAAFTLKQEHYDLALIALDGNSEETLHQTSQLMQSFPSLSVGFFTNAISDSIAQTACQYSALPLMEKPLTPDKVRSALEEAHRLRQEEVSLGKFHLLEILQMCALNQKTGMLRVVSPQASGNLYLQEGSPIHAEAVDEEGEEALRTIMAWPDIESFLTENISSPKATITRSLEEICEGSAPSNVDPNQDIPLNAQPELEELIGKTIGPFKVMREITSDGWGTLYEALQVAVNRSVALKILNPVFYGQEEARQFIAFAGAMAKAQNPYITTVYEAGEGNGLIFYARELVDGKNLQDYLNQERPLSEELAIQIIINIGEALHYESKNGILHTPLTPEQVLIPNTGVPKLLNNVTVEGGEISPGELDEMQRLGAMVRQALANIPVSAQVQELLNKLERAGQGGFTHWDITLYEARQIDLSLRAMKVTRPLRTQTVIEQPPPISPIKKIGIGAGVLALIGGLCIWFFFFSQKDSAGPQDIGSLIEVPGGTFLYQDGKETSLPTFYIDKYEVTIGEYRNFLQVWMEDKASIEEHPDRQATGEDHTPTDWKQIDAALRNKGTYKGISLNDEMPIFNVDYFDAWAYARWAGKRLPTEQEWEKAARGTKGKLFPWGNDFKLEGNHSWKALTPVGFRKEDRSEYGVMDMASNVSEWTDSWVPHPDFPTQQIPVVRGGFWGTTNLNLTIRNLKEIASQKKLSIGFRCVSDKKH